MSESELKNHKPQSIIGLVAIPDKFVPLWFVTGLGIQLDMMDAHSHRCFAHSEKNMSMPLYTRSILDLNSWTRKVNTLE